MFFDSWTKTCILSTLYNTILTEFLLSDVCRTVAVIAKFNIQLKNSIGYISQLSVGKNAQWLLGNDGQPEFSS